MFLSGKISLFKVAKVKYFLEINTVRALFQQEVFPQINHGFYSELGKVFWQNTFPLNTNSYPNNIPQEFQDDLCESLQFSREEAPGPLPWSERSNLYLPYKICETMQCKCNHSLQFFSTQPTSACNTGSLVCKYCSENAVILKCNIWTPTSYKGSKVFLRKLPTYDSEAGSLWTWATWELL